MAISCLFTRPGRLFEVANTWRLENFGHFGHPEASAETEKPGPGGFHSHGGTLIAGWFFEGKNHIENGHLKWIFSLIAW